MTNEIQKAYLESLTNTANPVTIFLLNGIKLQGVITGFDSEVILLRRDNSLQVIYKQAISTIMASNPVPEIENA